MLLFICFSSPGSLMALASSPYCLFLLLYLPSPGFFLLLFHPFFKNLPLLFFLATVLLSFFASSSATFTAVLFPANCELFLCFHYLSVLALPTLPSRLHLYDYSSRKLKNKNTHTHTHTDSTLPLQSVSK